MASSLRGSASVSSTRDAMALRLLRSRMSNRAVIDEFIRSLKATGEEFTEALWGSLLERVTVYRDDMVFLLTCGKEIRV